METPRRTPKNYDGVEVTSHRFDQLLPKVLNKISGVHHERPDLVLASWPQIIGPKLAAMTEAVSFVNGVLVVKVKNSTLHSLLSRNDKPKLLSALRQKFPKVEILNIMFKIG